MLTYLAECARAGLRVLSYEDEASGVMTWDGETYQFGEVVLRPRVVIEESGDQTLAEELHHKAHGICFIARSVNFPVRHKPEVSVGSGPARAVMGLVRRMGRELLEEGTYAAIGEGAIPYQEANQLFSGE